MSRKKTTQQEFAFGAPSLAGADTEDAGTVLSTPAAAFPVASYAGSLLSSKGAPVACPITCCLGVDIGTGVVWVSRPIWLRRGLTRPEELEFLREHQTSYGPCTDSIAPSEHYAALAMRAVQLGFYHPMSSYGARGIGAEETGMALLELGWVSPSVRAIK